MQRIMKRVSIIGGGIAGLATAYFLKEGLGKGDKEIDYIILEKKGYWGGNIRTEKTDAFLIEGGPDCFLSEKPWALKLCKRLGLEDRLLPTNENSQTYVLYRGKLHVLPAGFVLMIPTRIFPFLASPLISLPGKLRIALDLIIPRGSKEGDESLADFVKRRLGREVLEKIAEPLVAGVHAGDPENMSVRSSFPKFLEMEKEYRSLILGMLAKKRKMKGIHSTKGSERTMFMTLKGGLYELIDALVNRLDKESLHSNKEVIGIERDKKRSSYLIHVKGEKSLSVDSLVLATPAYVSARLVKKLDPLLSEKLYEIPYVSTATVSLAFKKSDIKSPLKGFGFVVPGKENRRIMAATWTSLKFSHRSPEDSLLMRCFIGGSKNEELVFLKEEEIIKIVREELTDIMGIQAEPIIIRVFRWRKSMPQYTIGHSNRLSVIAERLSGHPGLFLTGSAYRGIGISDCVHNGELTAKEVLKFLSTSSSESDR